MVWIMDFSVVTTRETRKQLHSGKQYRARIVVILLKGELSLLTEYFFILCLRTAYPKRGFPLNY